MLFDDTYLTIKAPSSGEFRDRGSRFLGFAWPIQKEEDVKSLLQNIKKEHPQANHHCYAFRITPDPTIFRASDDREPSGSAGKPILGAIVSKGLTDILIVVVRYFGGTLLGVPGLINAYREAATAALAQAEIIEKNITETFSIEFPYELTNEVHQLLRQHKASILNQNYESPCSVVFNLRKSAAQAFEKAHKEHNTLSYQTSIKAIIR
jgi:uncharacterized YigZ family protein